MTTINFQFITTIDTHNFSTWTDKQKLDDDDD